jgi:hypothetical protein
MAIEGQPARTKTLTIVFVFVSFGDREDSDEKERNPPFSSAQCLNQRFFGTEQHLSTSDA